MRPSNRKKKKDEFIEISNLNKSNDYKLELVSEVILPQNKINDMVENMIKDAVNNLKTIEESRDF